MSFFERFITLYAPHICLGCGAEEDALLCGNCRQTLVFVPSRCYRCQSATRNFAVCERCKSHTPLRTVVAVTHYDTLAKELVHSAKYERAVSGVAEMAAMMARSLRYFPASALLIPAPTATSRARARGYDQAVVLARALTKLSGRRTTIALHRLNQGHQVGAGRVERFAHLKNAFRVTKQTTIHGAHVVLIDDVSTTGATLESAATALKKAGAKRVDALVFAQAG